MRIAVDFDNTLVRTKPSEYPEIALISVSLFSALIDRQRKGDKIVLFTCREGEDLEKAFDICRKHGLEFDWYSTGKPYADIYIDDRALRPQGFMKLYNGDMLESTVERYNKQIEEG